MEGTRSARDRWAPPVVCPACRNEGLEAVSDGWDTNFLCPACGRCWHFELGWVALVDRATRHGGLPRRPSYEEA